MSRPFIVLGDKTDHGGVVIEASAMSDAAGKGLARVGDKVTCPQRGHGGTTVIVSGDPTMIVDGKAVARHGDKTACGATLIAGQVVAFVDERGDVQSSAPSAPASALQLAKAGQSLASSASPATAYDMHFRVQDIRTGAPVSGMPYRISLASGQAISGTTDANGLTQLIGSGSPESASLDVPFYGNVAPKAGSQSGQDVCAL